MPGVLVIPINLNDIHYETNYLKMIVENKVQFLKVYMNGRCRLDYQNL